jgi:hypothetical protein
MPFLTLEDPNAKIKGSRDPLGTVPMWLAFSRHIITNITTVSTSVRAFTTLLLGRYFAGRLIEERTIPAEEAVNVVLRMEQAAAHARHVGHHVDDDIRGIERVKRFLNEGRGRVPIQTDRRGFILSDQRVYGVWGLFTVAARRSGLLPEGSFGVTPVAQQFLEANYISKLNGSVKPIMRLLARGGTLDTRRHDPVYEGLVRILPPTFTAAEVEFYGRHIRDGEGGEGEDGDGSDPGVREAQHIQPRQSRQARFRHLLEAHTDLDTPVGRAEVRALREAARSTDEGLAEALQRIVHLESFLAPAAALFEFILTRHAQDPREVATAIHDHWGTAVPNLDPHAFENLLPEIAKTTTPEIAATLRSCHQALATGDYVAATRALLDWNAKVQERRNAAPWVLTTLTGELEVRLRDMEQPMPTADDLPTLWRNSYLINALKTITKQLRNTA